MALSGAPEPTGRPQHGRADSQGSNRWDEEPTREIPQRVAHPIKEIVEGGETKGIYNPRDAHHGHEEQAIGAA